MKKAVFSPKNLRVCVWLVLTLLVLSLYSTPSALGGIYDFMTLQSNISAMAPSVVLENGTAGTSTIYANGTSAMTSVGGSYWTYYPSWSGVLSGTYVSGSVPASVQSVDSEFFIVRSSGTATSTTAYNPSSYNLLGSTTLVSGSTSNLPSNDGVYMTFRSYVSAISAQTLYAHQDTISIGGTTYYRLMTSNPNAGGTTLSAGSDTTGRKLMGQFVYQLTSISNISASTWTMYYRARKSAASAASAHADVDILIRMANGTVRTTIATNVANSDALTGSWSTVSGTYAWTAYTVVDQTDYLEIDYYIEVTTSDAGSTVSLRIDDSGITTSLATRATNINLPSQFTSEVEFSGSSNAENWNYLVWTVDSAWTTGSVAVTIQVYNYTLGGYSTSGNGYDSYTSSATANTDQTRNQNITTNPTHFQNSTGYWKIKVKGVRTTATQFDFNADLIEFKPTYYTEYAVSTEFMSSSMTTNTPTQLNFTVVSQYDIGSVSVSIQIYNYTGLSYPTSGQGCLNYTSSSTPSTDETKFLLITTNPQDFVSSGNATIKVTGTKTTQTQFQQKTNQLKLDFKSTGINYNHVLKVVNNVSEVWQIRLTAYSDLNKNRLQNLTIYVYDGSNSTQIIILNGVYNKQTGSWYDLAASATEYIWVHVETSSASISYIYTYLEILSPNTSTYARYIITFQIT